jgi:hypothetical protein
MTWTYSDPGASPNDAVRFEVGDTDTTHQMVTDEEIAYALGLEGHPLYAAAAICSALAGKQSRQADRTMGKTQVMASQRATAWRHQAKALRIRAASYAVPIAGGLLHQEREDAASNIDTLKPAFTRELHEDILDLMPTPSPQGS